MKRLHSSRWLWAAAALGFASIALFSLPTKSAPKPYGIDKRVPWTTSRVVGSPEPPSPYMAALAFPNLKFDVPTVITRAPGTDRLFVATNEGKVYSFEDKRNTKDVELFLELEAKHDAKGQRTLHRHIHGLEFHPDFQKNGYVYVFSRERLPNPVRSRISRYETYPDNRFKVDPDSQLIVLEFPSIGHSGGSMKFGPDGYLYIGTGDGYGQEDPLQTGQDTSDLLSSVLRIDVDNTQPAKPYSIPADNPFVNTPGTRPEIWAFGFRQAWKISFDRKTGDLWVGEVGQSTWESIYRVKRGGNYGWSVKEGFQSFRPNRPLGPAPLSPPVVSHSHGEARSMTGGFVYHGSRLPELAGTYIYADWETGKIWALRYDRDNEKVTWHEELDDTSLDIAAFGETHSGELYMMTNQTGQIYELVKRPKLSDDEKPPPFPRMLSETGLFESTKDHQPAPGVIPYSVNSPLWSDAAEKDRFIALRDDSQIEYMKNGRWLFPEGAVLVKTFAIDMEQGNPASRRRLETRLLTLQSGPAGREQWAGYVYLWNDEQTDAELLGKDLLEKTYTIRDASAPGGTREKTWYYPSRTDCMICHNEKARFVLGVNTEQMNREHAYTGGTDNQIRTLQHIGLFDKPLPDRPDNLPRLVDPADESHTVDERVRSYLHANCAHCHQRGGGGNADIQLVYDIPLNETFMVNNAPQHGDMGVEGSVLLKPGDAEHSVLFTRMNMRTEGGMPHIGSLQVDKDAVELIRQWINSQTSD